MHIYIVNYLLKITWFIYVIFKTIFHSINRSYIYLKPPSIETVSVFSLRVRVELNLKCIS